MKADPPQEIRTYVTECGYPPCGKKCRSRRSTLEEHRAEMWEEDWKKRRVLGWTCGEHDAHLIRKYQHTQRKMGNSKVNV